MRLSLNWVGDHVDLSGLDPERIARDLTMRTALIEEVIDQRAALAGVVVGRVLERATHPDADRLSVCRVDFGGAEPAHVVCGAPNVAAGQTIAYAPVGTRLPNGIKLKKAKIRGQPSEGMICAEDELGLGPEHDGILVLPESDPGRPFAEVGGLVDVVLDIDNKSVTHRPDLWGHYGFARELATIYGRELKPLALAELSAGDEGAAISLEPDAGCPLYLGLAVEDTPSAAPDAMRFRLAACGMRPLGLLVDLSNYVMLETGQPTHPFDRDALSGDRIVVRRARAGEVLTTLDGEDRALVEEDLVIADSDRAVAIAGIMGGAETELGPGTTRMFLESATFDPTRVRRTSSRLGLRSEALARFEKDLDPALAELAVQRYAHLLASLRPEARIASCFRKEGDARAPERRIPLDPAMVSSRLGLQVSEEQVRQSLEGLGFGVSAAAGGTLEVDVPSWRATRDVTMPEDLVEEVGRIVGYDQVPTPTPRGPLLVAERDPRLAIEERLRDALSTRAAATEVFSYSTLSDDAIERLGLELPEGHPRLSNALQKDASRMRPAVAPSLLVHLEEWLRHSERVLTFEIGRAYAADDQGHPLERPEAAVLLARRGRGDGRDLVRALRGVLSVAVRGAVGREPELVRASEGSGEPWLHPARTAELRVDGSVIGRLGTLAPDLLPRLGLDDGEAAVAVLDVAALAEMSAAPSGYRAVSRFPETRIDLAFVAPYELSTDAIIEAIRKAGPKSLTRVEAFDVFRLDEGRSLAFHLGFQAADRTLTDKDVGKARDRIVRAVEGLGAKLR
jgi:phenylalanyl-tRNA synthetase beta chain